LPWICSKPHAESSLKTPQNVQRTRAIKTGSHSISQMFPYAHVSLFCPVKFVAIPVEDVNSRFSISSF